MGDVDEEDMQQLYQWIDEIPLSRPKRSISRDFSDGVLTAELVSHFFPKLVDLHNYSAANSVAQKQYNWKTLNSKVFKKMGFMVPQAQIDAVCNCGTGAIERVLNTVKTKALAAESGAQAGQVGAIMESGGKLPQRKERPLVTKVQLSNQPRSAPANEKPQGGARARGGAPRSESNQPPRRGNQVNQPQLVPAVDPQLDIKAQRQAQREKQIADQQAKLKQLQEQRNRPQPQPQPQPVEQPEDAPNRPTFNLPLGQARGNPRQAAGAAQPSKLNMMTEMAPSPVPEQMYLAKEQPAADVDSEILLEKETTINELRETVLILETKIEKLEQLLRLKDQKIGKLMQAIDPAH